MSDNAPIMVSDVVSRLELVSPGTTAADRPVTGGLVSDLLSYVMANGQPGQVWITVQGHANIIAIAALTALAGVIVAGGFQPENEAVARAEEEDILLFTSHYSPYTLAGMLYEMGVR